MVYIDGYGLYSRANLPAYKVSRASLFGEMQCQIMHTNIVYIVARAGYISHTHTKIGHARGTYN